MKHSNIKLTTEQFIERAKQKHGDKYDYSKVVYVKYNIKVITFCNTCNDFFLSTTNYSLQTWM